MAIIDALLAELEQESLTTRRVLDVPVPSVYGPTADENPFAAMPAGAQ